MKVSKNKLRRLQTSSLPAKGRAKNTATFSHSKVLSDYQTMLQLYLISREQATKEKELKYSRLTAVVKADEPKAASSVWNNFVQVIRKSNQLLLALSKPGMAMAGE